MIGYLFSAAGLSLLVSVLTTFHVLRFKHREAVSAILWIFVAFSFPFLGPLLYLVFGINRVEVKGLDLEAARQRLLTRDGTHAARVLRKREEYIGRHGNPGWPDFHVRAARALDRQLPDMPALSGNRIQLLRNGDETYPAMLEAIQEARSSIHMETYILRPDRIGRRFLDLLAWKARTGVRVRLLYDQLGSSDAHRGGFFDARRDAANLQIAPYSLFHPLRRRLQINLRNHRKLLVVDGRIGFLGGVNLQDGHVTAYEDAESIHDLHFEIRGPAVCELQFTFLQDWFFMTDEAPASLLHEEYFPTPEPAGEDFAREVRSGPGPDYEAIHRTFFTLLVMAERSIKLLTPYFVPDAALFEALKNAAARGVDVRLILPKRTNHWYVHYAARSFYAPLLQAGVRIFEREPPFIHAKALLVDNQWALVGSANFDIRSFRLNFELNLESQGPFAREVLRPVLAEELARSRELDLESFERRPRWEPMLESLCALASPLL